MYPDSISVCFIFIFPLLKHDFFKKNYVYAHVSVYMCVRKCHWGPERTSDPLELELQVTVSHLMWVLGTKSLSPGRAAAYALNHLSSPELYYKNPGNSHLPSEFIHVSCLVLCLFYLVPLLLVYSLVYLVGLLLFLCLLWDPAQCLLYIRSAISRIC